MERRGLQTRSIILGICLLAIPMLCLGAVKIEGETAPNFTLKATDGNNIRLNEYRGHVVMLNFWATWCGPCRQEMPHLNELYEAYDNLGFVVLGVNLDEKKQRAHSLASELGVTYPTLFDHDKKVSQTYKVDAMPTTVLIDRDGTIRHVHRGYRPGYIEMYQKQVRKLLRE